MTKDVQLSDNFSLSEFTRSDTAKARKLDNTPNATQIAALKVLCEKVLEPVRTHFGKPIRVTSGYRCFTPDSQHGKGEAADFEITGVPNITVARWIRDNLKFDQLILEAWDGMNAGWIHVSYRKGRLRQMVLRTPTGGPPYSPGLPS